MPRDARAAGGHCACLNYARRSASLSHWGSKSDRYLLAATCLFPFRERTYKTRLALSLFLWECLYQKGTKTNTNYCNFIGANSQRCLWKINRDGAGAASAAWPRPGPTVGVCCVHVRMERERHTQAASLTRWWRGAPVTFFAPARIRCAHFACAFCQK